MNFPFRIGQGFDVHALVPGRALIVGGVRIPFEHGLLGHSDADVLLHAVTDALLGAAGLGDIGRLFPDTDPAHAGADSRVLLREAFARVRAAGWEVVNIDATLICKAPRILPHAPAMVANLAADLDMDAAAINIKGKTTEKLGFTGRGEGIAAQVVALIARAGQGAATAAALQGYEAQWAGPDQYFVVAEGRGEGALYRELKAKLSGLASVTDQSHGRVIIRVSGPRARAVLAKGTPVDLHPDEFAVGKSALTQMAHVGVHLTRVAADVYDLSVFRGFSESFWEWITEQAEEFGYQVV